MSRYSLVFKATSVDACCNDGLAATTGCLQQRWVLKSILIYIEIYNHFESPLNSKNSPVRNITGINGSLENLSV